MTVHAGFLELYKHFAQQRGFPVTLCKLNVFSVVIGRMGTQRLQSKTLLYESAQAQ